jgi:hypothetical protein
MQPMKIKDKYKCVHCKIKLEQLNIFQLDKQQRKNHWELLSREKEIQSKQMFRMQ